MGPRFKSGPRHWAGLQGTRAGVVQLVERLLAKEKVTGSSPVARLDKLAARSTAAGLFWRHGDVAKW